jgi:hypothetical protein
LVRKEPKVRIQVLKVLQVPKEPKVHKEPKVEVQVLKVPQVLKVL